MRPTIYWLGVGLLVLTVGQEARAQICHPPSATPAAGTPQKAFDDLTAAFNARNIDDVLASMTPDLTLTYVEVGDLKRPDLDERFRKRLASETQRKIRTEIEEVCESGDLAVFRVTWHVTYTPPDGKVITTHERDMEIWRRDGGRWRLARGMSLPQKKS